MTNSAETQQPEEGMPNAQALMTTAEVAQALRVARQTVTRWANDGQLPFVLLPGGNRRRYRAETIARLLEPTEEG